LRGKLPGMPKLSYANVVSTICLFLLLGGAAVAATVLPKNSVGTKQLKNKSVTTAKIKDGAVTGSKVQVSSLGTVPSAASAASANSANTAATAANANALGGQPASAYAGTNLVRSATVAADGPLISSLSSGISTSQLSLTGTGLYCFHGLNPAPITAVVSTSIPVPAEQGATASVEVDPTNTECQVEVNTYDNKGADHREPFSVIIR
jgi:hypothetical protein